MTCTITTTLQNSTHYFLMQEAKQRHVAKNKILEESLLLYKKQKLEKEIQEGLKLRKGEYSKLNQEYLNAQSQSLIH